MKLKRMRFNHVVTASLFLAFILFTALTRIVDVKPIGPNGSSVGFAKVNQLVFDRLGVNLFWYTLTDWLGLVAIVFACGFATLGLCQLVRRGSIKAVDPDILLLGLYYLVVMGCYALFETVVINYRPVTLHGSLEPSYPSSHTMIVVCIMVTAMGQFHHRLRNICIIRVIDAFSSLIIAVTVVGRLLSGVHWCTDIVGGLILSAALTMLHHWASTIGLMKMRRR